MSLKDVQRARQELQDNTGRMALYFATLACLSEVAALLCDAPGGAAALSLRCNDGETPLDVAEAYGHATCAAMLRARGAKRGAEMRKGGPA